MENQSQSIRVSITPEELTGQRNQLLQTSLRATTQAYSIVDEYPLVLASNDVSRQTSFSAIAEGVVTGHASFFMRHYLGCNGSESFKIGLIGNVATDPAWRGRGIMRLLFKEIEQQMIRHEVSVALLWSDLIEFYQKLGFTSLGQENRFHLLRASCNAVGTEYYSAKLLPQGHATESLVLRLLALRQKTYGHVVRSVEEFLKLLQIPETFLFVEEVNGAVCSFAIIGKGADLVDVIHEWGSVTDDRIVSFTASIMDLVQIDELILLAPTSISKALNGQLVAIAAKAEKCPMALGMKNPHSPTAEAAWDALSKGFLWGLDSI